MIIHKHGESVLDHYYITGIIGNPYDSKARLGLHKVTGLERAIKEVSKAGITDLGDFLKKVKIVATLDHPNICKYLELFEDEYSYYFISEYLTGGDLWDAVHGLFGGFGGYTEETTAKVIKQLLQSVSYLHKRGIVHRNIRSGNILFAERGKSDIKLIDFDVAGTKTMEALSVNGGGLHGPFYSAPEVFKNDHNEKVDIWSIGVVLYFLLVGSLPFNGNSNEEVVAAIKKGKIVHQNEMLWNSITTEARDLIESLLNVNPTKRPSATEALEHPWFTMAIEGGLKGRDLSSALDNLKKFTGYSKIKQAMLGFFVQNMLSQQELNHLAQQFKEFDKDGSGALSPQELQVALKEVQGVDFNENEIKEIIKRIDADGDGEINYGEFLMASLNHNSLLSSERLEVAFRMFDVDGNGEISLQELHSLLSLAKSIDEETVMKALREIDGRSKKTIQFAEFKTLMSKLFG